MKERPYHHLPDGTFRNPKGSPVVISRSGKFSYRTFSKLRKKVDLTYPCLLYTSPSPRDVEESRMPSSA